MKTESRADSGRRLGVALRAYTGAARTLVLGIPRGGMEVAAALARALDLPLDVLCASRVRSPDDPRLCVGAVTELGTVLIDAESRGSKTAKDLQGEVWRAGREADWGRMLFRGGRPLPALAGMTLILADEATADASRLLAAAEGLRKLGPSWLIAAVPAAGSRELARLRQRVDEVTVLETLKPNATIKDLSSVSPVTDSDILGWLSYRRGKGGPKRRVSTNGSQPTA